MWLVHLGIDTASAITLAKSIAISSIRHTAKIKRARLNHGAGPWQTAEQAGGSGPPADPSPGPSTAHGQQPSTADAAGADPLANGHLSQDPSGEASSPSAANAMLPVALSDAACAIACNASPAQTPEPDEWQPVVRRKRPKGIPQRASNLAETESLICSRPDRACKRPRGSYAILADLDEEEPAASTAAPAARRGQKRDRQRTLLPAMPETLAASAVAPATASPEASRRDEAPTPPLLCPSDTPLAPPHTSAYVRCADAQPADTRRKTSQSAQATATLQGTKPSQHPSVQQTQLLRSKRKAVSQQISRRAARITTRGG